VRTFRFATLSLVAAALVFVPPALSADLAERSRAEMETSDTVAAVENYLSRKTALYLLRAMFNIVPADSVLGLLAKDAQSVVTWGPSEHELAQLDIDLLAEGSYLLVSLLYLTEVGGANWPSDRPERAYANDAREKLKALQEELLAAIAVRSDPISIFREADVICWRTEGYQTAPEKGHFDARDELMAQSLATFVHMAIPHNHTDYNADPRAVGTKGKQ
jgi:hypothetical protein